MKSACLALALVSCVPPYKVPAMYQQDREDYMMASGGYLRHDVREAFKEGRVIPGMPSDLILALYGEPDLVIKCPIQSLLCDRIQVYKTTATNTVGSVAVLNDTAISVLGQMTDPQRF